MDAVETRELTYFVTVAEELSFTRAAERLRIAQPPLSRAIQRLERRLGVSLLERTSRRVALTPAGEALLHDGRRALAAVAAATRRAQRIGSPDARLVLVMKSGGDGGLLPGILAAYGEDPDAIPVEIVFALAERAEMLRDGRADVGLLHNVNDLSGFDTEELLAEGRVVILSRGHRLAGRTAVVMADLEGETMPRWYGMPGNGATGPEVRDVGQLMQLIALGRTLALVPRSVLGLLREDLTCVPVLDAEPTTLLLAWPEGSRSRALAAFVRVAAAVAAHVRAGVA
jgi:DNA-binding transcriptional LysR family regulator